MSLNKKNKSFRSRRGIRFANGRRGVSPAAGFVGGPPITRTRPAEGVEENELRGVDSIIVGASSMTSVTGTFDMENTVSYGGAAARRALNVSLLGTASPSWTHASIGNNQAFVISAFTSSNHESTSLNLYRSGTEMLESSQVPATAPLYYSKMERFSTLIVKKSASFFDTVVPYSGALVPTTFFASTGTLLTMVTGSNTAPLSCSFRHPASIRIDVPQRGKLVDLKVWIEIVQDSGSAASPSGQHWPLSTIGVAIRSPNVRWGHAHPMRNDPILIRGYSDSAISSIDPDAPQDIYWPPAAFYRDTFLLWEGPGVYDTSHRGSSEPSNPAIGKLMPMWNRDRGMRTVFSDGGSTPNPRHLYSETSPSGNFVGSPNSALGRNNAYGMDVPWTSDVTAVPDVSTHKAAGSPPKGWLTGPANTAASNEWPTTGSNYGTNSIKPHYPLLESIYQIKRVGDESPIIGSIVNFVPGGLSFPAEPPSQWHGFRPGLRGTEISGTWEILFAGASNTFGPNGSWDSNSGAKLVNTYFRQVRLEFTFENNVGPASVRARTTLTPRRSGPMMVGRVSGSAPIIGDMQSGSWDAYVNETWINVPNSSEIGKTFGIQMNTGSYSDNYALLYRLTGALGTISGSAPGWLLNNRFGMPLIPESSASLSPSDPQSVVARLTPLATVYPRRELGSTQLLTDVAHDISPARTLIQLAADFVSGST